MLSKKHPRLQLIAGLPYWTVVQDLPPPTEGMDRPHRARLGWRQSCRLVRLTPPAASERLTAAFDPRFERFGIDPHLPADPDRWERTKYAPARTRETA